MLETREVTELRSERETIFATLTSMYDRVKSLTSPRLFQLHINSLTLLCQEFDVIQRQILQRNQRLPDKDRIEVEGVHSAFYSIVEKIIEKESSLSIAPSSQPQPSVAQPQFPEQSSTLPPLSMLVFSGEQGI